MSLPELDGLGQSDLDSLLSALRDEASDITAALSDASTADDADLDRLEVIATEVDAVTAALATVHAASADRAERAAALSARINPVQLAEEVVEDEPVAELEVIEEPVAEVAVVAAVHNVTSMPPMPRSVVARAPKPKSPANQDTRAISIVAAGGLTGVKHGQEVDLLEMVKPAVRRWENYSGLAFAQDELFKIKSVNRDPRLIANGHNDTDVMEYAASTARLKNAESGKQGIVAAGGWCAPAEQRYDICTIAQLDGILDVPTIAVPRGSISYFRQLDYSTVSAAVAAGEFTFTNAQLVNPTPVVKPCFEIPCATPVTATLDVVGLCLRAGLLQNKAFPELIAAWMELAMISFAHYRNARNIATMVAGSGSALVGPASATTIGTIAPVLDWLSIQAINYRFDNGMAADAELEVVLPFWFPAMVDADHIKRQFNSESPFDWAGALSRLNLRAQYVKDFQDSVFVGTGAVTLWPTTVNALMYAPGAWVRGTEDVITVSTLVDSTLLQTNRMQLLFFEAADQMMPWCGPSIFLTINVCATGATSGPVVPSGAVSCATV